MRYRERVQTSLGDALLNAGLRPAVAVQRRPNLRKETKPTTHRRSKDLDAALSGGANACVRRAAEIAGSGQQPPIRGREALLFSRVVIDEIQSQFDTETLTDSKVCRLVMALMCFCSDSNIRRDVAGTILTAATDGRIKRRHLNADGYGHAAPLLRAFLSSSEYRESYERSVERVFARQEERQRQAKIVERTRRYLGDIRNALTFLPACPEIRTPSLGTDDFRLIAAWAGHSCADDELSAASLRKLLASDYEFTRLWSARTAELAAYSYYGEMGADVADVALTQLDPESQNWKTHDLQVDGRVIDVKSARVSFANPDRYSGFFVPKFKTTNDDGEEVTIAGVLNRPYQSARNVLRAEPTTSLMLGEVRQSDLDLLSMWINDSYEGYLSAGTFAIDDKVPGWCFDYKWCRVEQAHRLSEALGSLADIETSEPWIAERLDIPPVVDASLIVRSMKAIIDDSHVDTSGDAISQLKCMVDALGLTRPVIFLFALTYSLSKIRSADSDWRPGELEQLLFWPGHAEGAKWPLGIYDPLKYVHGLILALDRLWTASPEKLRDFQSFYMHSPSILTGVDIQGRRRTVMAYCGGWTKFDGRSARCGENPLILGQNRNCESCGRLVCHSCAHCSDSCHDNVERTQTEWA